MGTYMYDYTYAGNHRNLHPAPCLVAQLCLTHEVLFLFRMCTHMADANSTSDYTNSQITKFASLLKRVRAAGISVPTVSTDNSAALLTTNLTHFDPAELLTQPDAHTRGYVRTGGAIYGQRPAFKQLKAVSTLLASVRHVAILKEGESVGYDRAYIAPRDVRIATLTLGFADGYPRELGNGVGKVAIRGALFSVAGNVCMDMLMVELGPAEEKEGVGATVVVGDVAVLWGPLDEDGDDDEGLVKLADLAKTLKTTQSALTCGLDKIRVLRQFV
jgi:alanine racemase